MLGQQFYHETIRKMVVSFGTIFNNIQIVRKNNAGATIQAMKVPLAIKQLRLHYLDLHLKYLLFLMTLLEN